MQITVCNSAKKSREISAKTPQFFTLIILIKCGSIFMMYRQHFTALRLFYFQEKGRLSQSETEEEEEIPVKKKTKDKKKGIKEEGKKKKKQNRKKTKRRG